MTSNLTNNSELNNSNTTESTQKIMDLSDDLQIKISQYIHNLPQEGIDNIIKQLNMKKTFKPFNKRVHILNNIMAVYDPNTFENNYNETPEITKAKNLNSIKTCLQKIVDKLNNSSMLDRTIINNNKKKYLTRWLYSLTEEELQDVKNSLEIYNNGDDYTTIQRLQRQLLGDYDPKDFIENPDFSNDQELHSHRQLLVSGFLEKMMKALRYYRRNLC